MADLTTDQDPVDTLLTQGYTRHAALDYQRHVADNIKKTYPQGTFPQDASPGEIVEFHRQDAGAEPDEDWENFVRTSYGQGWQPPKPSLMENVGQTAFG